MKSICICLLVFLGLLINYSKADNIEVPGEVATIQAGIDLAKDGDVVLVGPGEYNGRLNFKGKAITVKSSQGPLATTITGSAGMYTALVTFKNGEGENSILEGFRIEGGWLGVYCENSGPTIKGNIFINQNTTEWAAISLAGSGYPPSAGFGPAPAKIINNTIVYSHNGGISSFSTAAPIIKNNIIAFNAHYGIHLQEPFLPVDDSYNLLFGHIVDYYEIIPDPSTIYVNPLLDANNSLSEGSPCIDAGDPTDPVPSGGGARIDMGAVEYTGEEYICGDINSDGVINILDILYLLNYEFHGGPDPICR